MASSPTPKATSSGGAVGAAEGGSRRVALHPLAIVGVSDHFSRVEVGSAVQDASTPIVGLLFGKQDGLDVWIYDALELICDADRRINLEFLKKQTELYTAVYKGREMLGWYTVAREVSGEHVSLHKELLAFNESPLFMMMDPTPSNDSKDLPITIFEYEARATAEASASTFVSLTFRLETFQAEQIAMEQVASPSSIVALDSHIENVDNSLKTLRRRVGVVTDYLDLIACGAAEEDDKSGEKKMPIDYDLLRQISNLCDQLPSVSNKSSSNLNDDEDLGDYADSLAVAYLATLTKTAASVSQLTDNFLVIHHPGGGGGGVSSSSSNSPPASSTKVMM